MGRFKETLAEGKEGDIHLGPERDRVFTDLTPKEKDRYNTNIRAINILLEGLPKDIYTLINRYTDAKDIWDNVKMLLEGGHDTAVDEDVDEPPIQNLVLNVNNVFQANECDAFDSDVDEAPTAQTIFMQICGHDTAVDEDVDEPPIQNLVLNVNNVFQAVECDAFDSDVDEAPTAQTIFMQISIVCSCVACRVLSYWIRLLYGYAYFVGMILYWKRLLCGYDVVWLQYHESLDRGVSLLLTPLCCDGTHEVTPRVSAMAGYDKLVSEPAYDSKEEQIEENPLEELKEEG
nr:integrase, catalytic region, zinc finger, CCHC-type, peptidase aspartic, catalytic [Tanacetum cinerariifolium]